jgi:glycine cleavage system H protein
MEVYMSKPEKGMNVPEDLLYTEDHEWIRIIDDNNGICGITDHAQNALGDIVFVEFISNIVHTKVERRETVAVVESPKAASDVYAPASGTILNINRKVEDAPELINQDPYGEGWLFKIEIADKSSLQNLLKPSDYLKQTKGG